MRNLQVFSTKVYPADEKLKDAQDFCLNCDSGCVWIATTTALCCIEASDGVSACNLIDHCETLYPMNKVSFTTFHLQVRLASLISFWFLPLAVTM